MIKAIEAEEDDREARRAGGLSESFLSEPRDVVAAQLILRICIMVGPLDLEEAAPLFDFVN
jgi:hypothetical protein